jgi:hypothetical protein
MVAVKLISQLLSWTGIVLLLLRGYPGRRPVVAAASIAGFALGVAGGGILLRTFTGEIPFGIIKTAVGGSFILLCVVSVATLYRSTGRGYAPSWEERFVAGPLPVGACSLLSGILMGGVCACRLPLADSSLPVYAILALAGAAFASAAYALEKLLPAEITVSQAGLAASVVSLLLFSCSTMPRLDLFSPLTMKVMKFTHDFVHQFFESMLIPDHFFFNSFTWDFIGFFFSKEVGFWGGGVIWFTPVVLVLLAISFEQLPSVAHIRQGAQRRRLLSAAIRARRFKLGIPVIAMAILASAIYRSCFPGVEYWDPKPLPVSANTAGEIFIPKKGEIDLEDGKLHKYIFKQGGREARFFVLMIPAGKLTVDLDACAICKPDGYGQAEGTVICYYCKTLIPLETVGKPGGCNPVPVPFMVKEDGVHIDGTTLLNNWSETVQATTRIKGGDK